MPERSFFYKGKQFPLCSRCTGVVAGQFLAMLVNVFTNVSWRISLLFLGIMGVDWSIQEVGIKTSTNRRRLITGIFGGFGMFNIYCIGIKKLIALIKK